MILILEYVNINVLSNYTNYIEISMITSVAIFVGAIYIHIITKHYFMSNQILELTVIGKAVSSNYFEPVEKFICNSKLRTYKSQIRTGNSLNETIR